MSIGLGAVLLAVLLELGSYAYLRIARGYDGEHLMNYQFDPYKSIQLTPGYRDTRGVEHNAQGFRRSESTPREKPPGTLRVFLMGGSTAYGLGSLSRYGGDFEVIRNDETIDHYLQELLRGTVPGRTVEVINAAITSFYSHHHLIYLNQVVLKYDPDVVVFLDGFNDYFPMQEGFDQFRDYAYQERAHSFMGEPTFDAWAHYTGWWLFRKSHFFNVLGRALRNLGYILPSSNGERARIDVDVALENLRANAEANWVRMVERNSLILEHEGVGAVFALQPEIAFEQSKRFAGMEQQIREEMVDLWPEGFIEFKNRARPIVLEQLGRAAAVGGARAADLTDIYGGLEEDAYTDYCHLTPAGNRVLAQALTPVVLELLLEREAAPVHAGR